MIIILLDQKKTFTDKRVKYFKGDTNNIHNILGKYKKINSIFILENLQNFSKL